MARRRPLRPDHFRTAGTALFPDPCTFNGTLGPGPFIAAPLIGIGTHDNVDAYNDVPVPVLNGTAAPPRIHTFFSLAPADAFPLAASPADVFDVPPFAALVVAFPPWAPAPMMGLDLLAPVPDNIDALVVWNNSGNLGPAWGGAGPVPGMDCALFSLSPGSPSLGVIGFDPGTLFFTDFTGAFAVYAFSGFDLGLASAPGTAINVDALEVQ